MYDKKKVDTEKEKKYLEDSKDRFKKILETKMKTTFIGALSRFEQKFGFLWGDKNCQVSSSNIRIMECLHKSGIDQEILLEMWQEIRESILNNGNNQLRALENELEQYTLHWDRYRLVLPVKPRGEH